MDNLTKAQRHKNMQAIRSTNTGIENLLCSALWKKGYRYRRNCRNIFGKPDIVFRKYKIAVFCDSEFWHGKDYVKETDRIGTHQKYWREKIQRNIKRDRKVNRTLKKEGWIVLRFWGKDIQKNTERCAGKIISKINQISSQK
ncbi:very short patch repair endonuclease [Candidatus Avelusimicrobium sp.]